MSTRIFISGRTADGADKATEQARDLEQVFGHEAVLHIDIALKVLALPGGSEPVDSGILSASLSPDRRQLAGRIWLDGAQSEQPAMLRREP